MGTVRRTRHHSTGTTDALILSPANTLLHWKRFPHRDCGMRGLLNLQLLLVLSLIFHQRTGTARSVRRCHSG